MYRPQHHMGLRVRCGWSMLKFDKKRNCLSQYVVCITLCVLQSRCSILCTCCIIVSLKVFYGCEARRSSLASTNISFAEFKAKVVGLFEEEVPSSE